MLIDTHCHIDYLIDPEDYLAEKEKIGDITIGVTNSPEYFQIGYPYFSGLKKSCIALGFHPQLVNDIWYELQRFPKLVKLTNYVGEIGLDFSRDFKNTKEAQMFAFDRICSILKNETPKIVTVHSRGAEKETFAILKMHKIKNVIFHWYTGPLGIIDDILAEDYYFSINEAMTKSKNGQKIIERIPKDRILTETDAPFNKHHDIKKALENMGISEKVVESNFANLLNKLNH